MTTLIAVLLVSAMPASALPSVGLALTPAVIDGEAKAREILRYKVNITNTANHGMVVYPWARDIDTGGEVLSREGVDPASSLLSWMEFSRAQISISAGQSVELPVLVQVNLRAKPGMYHATLYLSPGPNRAEAELNTAETALMSVNIRVPDDANERLSLGAFSSDKNMFTGDSASFAYRLENTGNRGIIPTGKIRIFDRRGAEVDVVDVNAGSSKIEPEASELLGAVWRSGDHFGKYKAMLDVSYGKTGTIQDTVFFWVLPWKRLLSLFLTLALICVILSLLFHSYTASGGRKLAFVQEGFSHDEEDEGDEGRSRSFVMGIKERMRELMRRYVQAENRAVLHKHRALPITEIEPPEPVRTHYSAAQHQSGATPVRLVHRKKHPTHDPAHVVHLKK